MAQQHFADPVTWHAAPKTEAETVAKALKCDQNQQSEPIN